MAELEELTRPNGPFADLVQGHIHRRLSRVVSQEQWRTLEMGASELVIGASSTGQREDIPQDVWQRIDGPITSLYQVFFWTSLMHNAAAHIANDLIDAAPQGIRDPAILTPSSLEFAALVPEALWGNPEVAKRRDGNVVDRILTSTRVAFAATVARESYLDGGPYAPVEFDTDLNISTWVDAAAFEIEAKRMRPVPKAEATKRMRLEMGYANRLINLYEQVFGGAISIATGFMNTPPESLLYARDAVQKVLLNEIDVMPIAGSASRNEIRELLERDRGEFAEMQPNIPRPGDFSVEAVTSRKINLDDVLGF